MSEHSLFLIETYVKPTQARLGLLADGVDGVKTWAAIYKAIFGADAEQASPASVAPVAVPSGPLVDARSETAIATLHPRVQPLARQLVRDAAAAGITIKVTSGTRTYAEQDSLYEQGRSRTGSVVTNARGGQSNHNFGVAFDVTVFDGVVPIWESPRYKTVGQLGKALGLEWGGDWKTINDEPHFELHPDWAKGQSEGALLAGLRERHDSRRDAFA